MTTHLINLDSVTPRQRGNALPVNRFGISTDANDLYDDTVDDFAKIAEALLARAYCE